MRAIGAAAAAARRHAPHLPTSYAAAFSSSSSGFGGGGAAGRGRGRGLPPSPTPPPRAPGRIPIPADDDGGGADPFSFSPPPIGRGRGETLIPSASPTIPPFSAAGRGRGSPLPSPPPPPPPGEVSEATSSSDPPPPPRPLLSSGAGRGVPRMQQKQKQPVDKPQGQEENRFIRRREEKKAAAAAKSASASPASPRSASQPKLSAEDAVKRAMELLGGGDGAGRGRADDGGQQRNNNRRVPGRRRPVDGEEKLAIYLGENADGDRLEKRLGEDKMKIFNQAFEDAADNTLPSPMEDAYLEAAHTNNMIEFEPEYNVNFDNPDIDEKPPMPLEDMLQKVKPFIVAYEGIQNQEEWEEAVKDVMARAPRMKELIDMYSGPDVVTAKQQEEELQRVANTLPGNIPSSVKRFTDKTLLSLKNNPGWGFDKKCQFMDKFAREVSELYK